MSGARPAVRRPAPQRPAARSVRVARGLPRGFSAEREPLTGGTLLRARTPSGTPVLVRPMPGFAKAYAVLATRFGSLDETLPDGSPLPPGLAHFLEHKMFETPEGDVFDVYARRGASANAYTTFGWTSYLFSCTSRFEENLVTLLDTLRTMHAEREGIEREKGIIGQEIAMYDDDPGWRGHFNLLSALYRDHPIRIDIPGTKETIAAIHRDVLLRTHAAYYHPANLALVVAGAVDPARVLALASERLAAAGPGRLHRRAPVPEPDAPALPERRQALSVSRPQVTLGIKDASPGTDGDALVALETETALLLDVLFGDGGRVQAPLYREGLVDEGFGASFHAGPDFAFVSVSGEVDAEAPYRERLLALLADSARTPISEDEVERARRRGIGGWLRAFNGPEGLVGLHLGLHMRGASLGAPLDAIRRTTPRRLDARLAGLLARGRAWSVVHPGATA